MSKTTLKQKFALGAFAFLATLVFLEILLRLGGSLFYYLQAKRNADSNSQGQVYRIMCIGESTTALGGESSYPSQLEEILNQKSKSRRFKVINCGMPSSTSGTILSHLEDNIKRYRPDCIVAMIGANDTEYFGLPSGPIDQVRFLLQRSRALKLFKIMYLHIRQRIVEIEGQQDGRQLLLTFPSQNSFFQDLTDSFSNKPNEIENLQRLITKLENSQKQREMLGEYFRQKGFDDKFRETKAILKENDKNMSRLLTELALHYLNRGQADQAESLLKKAIMVDEKNPMAYVIFGQCCLTKKDYRGAIGFFELAVTLDPENPKLYYNLGRSFKDFGKVNEAIIVYLKAIAIDGKNYLAYTELAKWFEELGQYDRAQGMLLKAIDIAPKNYLGYHELGELYLRNKQYDMVEELYKKAISFNPQEERFYRHLAECYRRSGKVDLAKEYFKKSEELKSRYYSLVTIRNYNEMATLALQGGIKFVFMQYPLRGIDLLKQVISKRDAVTFVGNEDRFQDAVDNGRYSEFFTDQFAGDFGHCTRKGNRAIAENLANTILNEVFKE